MAAKKNYKTNGSNYFRIQKTVGYTYDESGQKKQIQKSFYGTSELDAKRKYEAWMREQALGNTHGSDMRVTFGTLAETYDKKVLSVSGKYSPGTVARYSGANKNWILTNRRLCSIPIKELSAMDLQLFYNGLKCSDATMKQIHKFMSGLFRWLVMQGFTNNLLDAVEIPAKEKPSTKGVLTWTDAELHQIVSGLDTYRNGSFRLRFFILLCTMSGLRIGEELGLKYNDIEGNILHVRRQYNLGELRPPKSESYRDIPLAPILADELLLHRAWHEKEMQTKRYQTDFVFTTESGNLLEYGNVRRSLNRFYKSIGVPEKKFHTYRSTFCTQLCRAGVPIQVASQLLGHKSIEVTAKYYTDVNIQDKADAIALLNPVQITL